jgi:pimeloyl-ACP methyl ester carboxylesterase
MPTLTLHSLPIHYNILGTGTPIVMLHGWGPDQRIMSGCFEPLFESLPEGSYQRIYFDLPGMGQTPGANWISGPDQMLDVVLEFIDAVIPGQNFLMAGESYGGHLARGVIAKRPDQVAGLLLICPAVETIDDKHNLPPFQVMEKDEPLLASLSVEDRASFTFINVRQIERVWNRYRVEVIPGVHLADYPLWDRTIGQHKRFTFNIDQLDKPYIKPTLMLMGRQDNIVGYRDQWDFMEDYPRASFVVLDKAGHNLQIEQDVLFNALVKEWLDRVKAENR